MWRPFVSWLERKHPDALAVVITVGDADGIWPVWTDDSNALWAKYVDDWVESQQ